MILGEINYLLVEVFTRCHLQKENFLRIRFIGALKNQYNRVVGPINVPEPAVPRD